MLFEIQTLIKEMHILITWKKRINKEQKLVSIYLPSSGEIEGIYEAKGSSTSGTTRGEVTNKVTPELLVFVDSA